MRYTSKQVRIARSDEEIFRILSDFQHFSPIVAGRVEGWEATAERCRFRVKGMTVGLKMVERQPNKLIKVSADDSMGSGAVPMPFTFWVQMKDSTGESAVAPQTHLRIVLEIELNLMMKMLIGGKLQGALDTIAEQIAGAFNNPGNIQP